MLEIFCARYLAPLSSAHSKLRLLISISVLHFGNRGSLLAEMNKILKHLNIPPPFSLSFFSNEGCRQGRGKECKTRLDQKVIKCVEA